MPIEFLAEREFSVNGLTLAAREYGEPGAKPVLAVHGWLDNCASFEPLSGQFRDMHMVAVDCAGHGKSSRRSADSGYNIWQDVDELFQVADQMGWESFNLVAHSRGAIIACLMAGTLPERINKLVLIDGFISPPVDAAHAPKQLAAHIRDKKRFAALSPTCFPSFEQAVTGRANGFMKLSEMAAEVLARRGVAACENGYFWDNDQQLKAASEFKLTIEHQRGFLSAITADVLLLEAEQGVLAPRGDHSAALDWITSVRREVLPGGHHLHMEAEVGLVAHHIQQFLA